MAITELTPDATLEDIQRVFRETAAYKRLDDLDMAHRHSEAISYWMEAVAMRGQHGDEQFTVQDLSKLLDRVETFIVSASAASSPTVRYGFANLR